ncbi:glutamate--tRNA ligase [Taurinivorans muris]|uniref:Glutamate--tRNA ligase n=1 Tax=Taurinivorans muris TaxID=2787751 RepID=A0ABY5Y301_9BACT|nr:glutamate--tRNA ligase [Desulfovibrionaceae bacterium LT0009]
MKVVTRFAPSPTGHLHIGGGRTAIFCWLLARHFGGEFRLRIEDTDTERSKQEYTDSILASMKWLGLDWDGDLTYQSQRKDVYNKYVDKLLETGHAYYCDCSVEEVEAMREVARAKGEKPRYNGKCRERGLGYAEGRVVRLKVPAEGRVVFDDMVKGPIAVDVNELDDMVLRRADGMPTYNMAVVVDDYEMGVTHVVRGDDHVSNTPKQILIYQALGLAVPTFGHVPMILGPDKQKLSKRHGARAVVEYQQDGLLPEALVNYLVRLGWSHGDQEIFSLQELVKLFDGKNLNSSAAAFDPDKLQWLNGYYLKHTPLDKAVELTRPFIEKSGLSLDGKNAEAAISLYIERASNLNDLAEQVKPYLQNIEDVVFEEKALNALDGQGKEQIKNVLALVRDTEFTAENLEHVIHDYVETSGVKFKLVGTPLRSALIGLAGGPSIHLIMFALGKAETIKRLERALA